MKIPLIKPYINEEMKTEMIKVLESGYWTEGDVTQAFEISIKEYLGVRNVLAVCNCTVGLEMALRAFKICAGDEVIVPDYTYPATASVVCIVGATPVIVDVNPDTMLMNLDALEKAITPKTKAVIPVSIFGNPLNYKRMLEIKHKYNLHIIEDAACSIGAESDSVKVGNLADITVFSLHPRKFITTGEGGIVVTNDDNIARWMNSYKHFGMTSQVTQTVSTFEHIGTNYKLSNIQAILGLVQMKHVDELLTKRRALALRYHNAFKDIKGISIPKTSPKGVHSFQSCCIFIKNRDWIIKKLAQENIQAQIGTYALHMHKAFYDHPDCRINGDMAGSRYAFEHCLTLPLYHEMTREEQQFVIEKIIKLCAESAEY